MSAGRDSDSSLLSQIRTLLSTFRAPRLAIIGMTGVGKSSTINALVGSDLTVGHRRPGTIKPELVSVKLGRRGALELCDLPGVGERVSNNAEIMAMYESELPSADVVLWVLDANVRVYMPIQSALSKLIDSKVIDPDRLVFGLNRVDQIQPGSWNYRTNLPSREQSLEIEKAVLYAQEIMEEIQLSSPSVVGYSALRRFHLEKLFVSLTYAMPQRVQANFYRLRQIANSAELRDEELQRLVDATLGPIVDV